MCSGAPRKEPDSWITSYQFFDLSMLQCRAAQFPSFAAQAHDTQCITTATMMGVAFVIYALALVGTLQSQSAFGLGNLVPYAQSPSSDNYTVTCENIVASISSASHVFYLDFSSDISHWANSSSQVPMWSVEPGTPSDVGLVLREIACARVPFAVKGGGHATNPGFSSTLGIHISMTRFKEIVIDEDSGTIHIGAGLTWTDVYAYLTPKNFSVVGGRLNGVGVAGLTLGGGYSWKWKSIWAHCGHCYGIRIRVAKWRGNRSDREGRRSLVRPQEVISQYGREIRVLFGISLFYDGPEPPETLCHELMNLSTTSKSIVQGAFTDFVSSQFLPTYKRANFEGIRKRDQGPSACPPNRSLPILPSSIYIGWTNESADEYMADAMRVSAATLVEAGIQDGQDLKNAAPYVNYALFRTPVETMYGEHLERLSRIREKYDPEDVMGLAGGWTFYVSDARVVFGLYLSNWIAAPAGIAIIYFDKPSDEWSWS
ncbi:hypothetical protein BJV74DRAFT_796325 [Russula compacta]|nr:hypothetical protein BJV74DRAFT_796325 [Russula compacta]